MVRFPMCGCQCHTRGWPEVQWKDITDQDEDRHEPLGMLCALLATQVPVTPDNHWMVSHLCCLPGCRTHPSLYLLTYIFLYIPTVLSQEGQGDSAAAHVLCTAQLKCAQRV